MALTIVRGAEALQSAQKKLFFAFKQRNAAKLTRKIEARGSGQDRVVRWIADPGIWACMRTDGWNGFGTSNAVEKDSLVPSCLVHFSLEDFDPELGGAVAEDAAGGLALVHTGKIVGGKSKFWDDAEGYKGKRDFLVHGGKDVPVAVVGFLDSPSFISDLYAFVQEVERIKMPTGRKDVSDVAIESHSS